MPIIDSRTLPDGHEIEADLCIIGSGAAGLTLANELAGDAATVAILESGGLDLDESMQSLNAGETVGVAYAPLERTWLRMLGGTTNHWTAFVRPIEANVFDERVWIPHSGWPITAPELSPFYDRALRFLRVPDRPFDVDRLAQQTGQKPWRFSADAVITEVLHVVAPAERLFAKTLRPKLEGEKNLRVHLFATVLEIRPDPGVRRVDHLRVGTPEGKRFTARARCYVLAGGAIENARLLLLSNRVQAAGLANGKDLVGRFFANHPTQHGLDLQLSRSDLSPRFYSRTPHGNGLALAYLAPSAESQRRQRLPRVRFQIRDVEKRGKRRRSERAPEEGATLRHDLAHVIADVENTADDARDDRRSPPPVVSVLALFEPFPDPDNRVRLGEARDRFGQRRVVLEWRFDDVFRATVQRCLLAFALGLGRSGIGRLRIPPIHLRAEGNFHHMGTTRMHSDPSRGVVDADCRAHGIDNLYIAGSSVFPCYGVANPTLTIMALAFRLADHLKGRLHAT